MKTNGGSALIKALEMEGVDVIFGLPGGAILPVYDPILDSPIRHILVRHEQGAGHMAEGYAHATGRPGVAMVTSGPAACGDWTSHYESVIGFGSAEIVTDDESRQRGLQAIMGKYSGRRDWQFAPETFAKTVIVRVRLDSLTGKRSPAKT